ncbi:hypothetical protein WR25_20582 [Diploscapter pachys]|uniref:Lipocalin domain-containing protein n=1 Tax=Diploscapter pachys TaxID=2018661 RepID=A0A2A2K5E8_9BILA|nr:hypothetical protein WR25_20582 [Diploscapter pachys]
MMPRLRLCNCLLISVLSFNYVLAQYDTFSLPHVPKHAPRPTIPSEYSKYFELDGHARQFVDTILGPRPGGLFPEKTYEIATEDEENNDKRPMHVPSALERTLEDFFTAPEPKKKVPDTFGSGFSLVNNNNRVAAWGDVRRAPQTEEKVTKETEKEDVVEGSGEAKSSIHGIPKIFPKLPKAPVYEPQQNPLRPNRLSVSDVPAFPRIQSAPEVPEGGFLPADVRRAPQSVSEVVASSHDGPEESINGEEYGGLSDETSTSSGGLIGTILNMIQLGAKTAKKNVANGQNAANSTADKNAIGKAVSRLLGGENSPIPGKNMISNVLYKALTSGSLQSNESAPTSSNGSIVLTKAQSAAIGENLELIQNLIIQPSSPLCTAKPVPIEFDINGFMGQWYQVLYTPPLSSGPCSMVAYKKLSDVNNGGSGSIFEVFEYTTDGTPYGKPKISSGYAIIKSPGELLYRTTNNQDDVNVHVLHVGPLDKNNQYEYAVMSTNCNFPIYVFARDPTEYKRVYEDEVNEFLEKKGIVNGLSRLLNVISPVDNSMCTFPPALFNLQG